MENSVKISGVIFSEPEFNNTQYGESFYKMMILTERNSGTNDLVPVLISDRLINIREKHYGKYINITGQFRSYNEHEEKKNKLILYVFVKECEFVDKHGEDDVNYIELTGFICKEPVYRKTPLGREIADLLIAVNRPYGKSDYIPCICWGRNARFVSKLCVGSQCKIIGRIQSREYTKTSDEMIKIKMAYEVSISQLEVFNDTGGNI